MKFAFQGDSGAPVAYRTYDGLGPFTLAGIVSTGFGCGLAEFPGIYIPMNNPTYLSWIKRVAFEGFADSANHADFYENPHCWRTPFEREKRYEGDGCLPL